MDQEQDDMSAIAFWRNLIGRLLFQEDFIRGRYDKALLYKDKRGQWRWRVIAPNGEIVGASTESYASKLNAESNLRRFYIWNRIEIRTTREESDDAAEAEE